MHEYQDARGSSVQLYDVNGTHLALLSLTGKLVVFEAATGHQLWARDYEQARITGLALTTDHRHLLLSLLDRVQCLEITTGNTTREIMYPESQAFAQWRETKRADETP